MSDIVRIIHGADFHLDAKPPSWLNASDALQRAEERFETFTRVMDMTRENEAELVLIPGDLFETEHVRRGTILRIIEKFEELDPIHVLIAPGNHDPWGAESPYEVFRWPENVHIFPGGWSQWRFPKRRCMVSGFGWDRAEISAPLLQQCPNVEEEMTHIILIHGDLLPVQGKSRYLPITKEDLESCAADYIAIGHIHRAEPEQEGKLEQPWMNPGAVEPLDFGDAEKLRGVVIGNAGEDVSQLALETLEPSREFRIRTVDISGSRHTGDTAEKIYESVPPEQRERDFFRIKLVGQLDPDMDFAADEIEALLEDRFYCLHLIDETRPKYDLEALGKENGFRGEFVREMQNRISATDDESEKKKIEKAVELGLAAMDGRDVNRKIRGIISSLRPQ
ncbi:MAG: DNA repair exonuclease [Planctomycetes bacterium]|nr:DNA repair exonuclease [Planctomycetota bacterium]